MLWGATATGREEVIPLIPSPPKRNGPESGDDRLGPLNPSLGKETNAMSKDTAVPNGPDEFEEHSWTNVQRPGDVISGELIERATLTTEKFGGGEAELLRIRTSDGEAWDVPCWRAHLRQLVEKHDPQVGDRVLIRAFGPEPGGRQELYAMRVTRKGSQGSLEPDAVAGDEVKAPTQAARPAQRSDVPMNVEGLTVDSSDDDVPF
jgi:hypothetical protein